MKRYVQCLLRRVSADERFVESQTAWIERRGAKRGAEVELKPSNERWTVQKVYASIELDETQLRELRTLNRASLPSVEAMR